MYSELSELQKRFVDEYLIDLNATAAYKRAGYKAKNDNVAAVSSKQLLSKPKIEAAVAERRAAQTQRTEIDADWVLTSIKEVAQRCMQAIPVMVKEDGEWVETGEYKFDSTGANKSLELLGKHLKLFTDKVEQENTGEVKIMFNVPRPSYKKKEG